MGSSPYYLIQHCLNILFLLLTVMDVGGWHLAVAITSKLQKFEEFTKLTLTLSIPRALNGFLMPSES